MSLKSIEETKNDIISKFYIYIVQLYVFYLNGEIFREISFLYFFFHYNRKHKLQHWS